MKRNTFKLILHICFVFLVACFPIITIFLDVSIVAVLIVAALIVTQLYMIYMLRKNLKKEFERRIPKIKQGKKTIYKTSRVTRFVENKYIVGWLVLTSEDIIFEPYDEGNESYQVVIFAGNITEANRKKVSLLRVQRFMININNNRYVFKVFYTKKWLECMNRLLEKNGLEL